MGITTFILNGVTWEKYSYDDYLKKYLTIFYVHRSVEDDDWVGKYNSTTFPAKTCILDDFN